MLFKNSLRKRLNIAEAHILIIFAPYSLSCQSESPYAAE